MTGSIPLRFLLCLLLTIIFTLSSHAGWEASGVEAADALLLEGDVERGRLIYEDCAICHMPEGWGTPNGAYPQLAGQHRSVVIKQLADIRAKNRDNPSMYPFSIAEEIGGVQSIADVAVYIENLKMTTATGKGSGEDLAYGEQLYQEHCRDCHGEKGEGREDSAYPRLQGQHYLYLLRQMSWIQSGKRRNANREMRGAINEFKQRELMAVSDYLSRLVPDETRRSPRPSQGQK